jgi:hypothetical protein
LAGYKLGLLTQQLYMRRGRKHVEFYDELFSQLKDASNDQEGRLLFYETFEQYQSRRVELIAECMRLWVISQNSAPNSPIPVTAHDIPYRFVVPRTQEGASSGAIGQETPMYPKCCFGMKLGYYAYAAKWAVPIPQTADNNAISHQAIKLHEDKSYALKTDDYVRLIEILKRQQLW